MRPIKLIIFGMSTIFNSAYGYDITDAINAALQNNTQLKESAINFQSAKLNRFEAATEFLPKVVIRSDSSNSSSNGTSIQSGTPRSDQLIIQQEIFSGGKGIYDLKATKYGTEAAAIQYQNNINAIVIQTVQAYEMVIASRGVYNVTQQNVNFLKKIVKQSEIKLSVGTITKTNFLEAKASLASAVSEQEKAYSDMKNQEENFLYITGTKAPVDMNEIDIKNLILPNNIDLFFEQVENNNQNIIAADKNLNAKTFATRSAKSILFPTVTASASVGTQKSWQQSFFSPPSLQKFDSETYQLSVNIPLFQSGKEYVRIKKAQLEENIASIGKDNIILKTHQDAASEWNRYQQSRVSVQSDGDSVDFYEEYLRGSDEEFQIGTKTLTDLLQAQVKYENARNKLIQDKTLMIISALNLRFIMGNLDKVDFSKLVMQKNNQQHHNPNVAKTSTYSSNEKVEKIAELSTDKQA